MIATRFSRLHLKLNASVFQVIFIYIAVLPLIINTSPGPGGHGNGNTFAVAAPLELANISPRIQPIVEMEMWVPNGLGDEVFTNIDEYVDKKKRDEMFAHELTSTSVRFLGTKLDVAGKTHRGVWDVKYNDKPASGPSPDHTGILLKRYSQLNDEIYAEVYALGERKELVASGKMKNSLFPSGAAPNSADAYSYVVLQWKYPGRVLNDIAEDLKAKPPNAWVPGKGKTADTAYDQWVGKTARKACKKVVDDAFADPKGIYHESNHQRNFLCVCADGTDCGNIKDIVKIYPIDWGKYSFIDKKNLPKEALFMFCLEKEFSWIPKDFLKDESFITYPEKDSDI